jgi:hypothetical protein
MDFSWFTPFMEPVVVLDHLVRVLGYFEQDLNILKL